MEEVQWFDIMVRRPHDSNAHRRARELQRGNICPTEMFTSTYPQAGRDKEDVKLMLKGWSNRMGCVRCTLQLPSYRQ